ncbi:MAG TPA: GNAT family N-acetyltransferase [Candidatus Limnocylindria bacterium]|jgi:2-oxo-4-hydroxy-4-carboxy--5-ureidoimidazoline (OHCU) decarboxylase/GNAT superfamily N-acetyltransferase|nr:GNAT family N-acetyltransferase [Candidatus Limnocylindria bacterium]
MSSVTHAADVEVRDLAPADHGWARELIARHQGGTHEVARLGELIDPLTLDGLVAEAAGGPIGMAAVHETPARGLEVVVLMSEASGQGAGSALLETARQVAVASGHHRLWLVTTNDNLEAIHFYLGRGMRVATVHADAVAADRALKPQISERNTDNGLPIRDLVEFELAGDDLQAPMSTRGFPLTADLDLLPAEAFVHEMSPLFEGGGRFLARLAELRPFETDEGMLGAAFDAARGATEDEQVELVQAHPPIGADPETVSAMSFAEQGYGAEATGQDGEEESLFSDAELAQEAGAQRSREIARAYEELKMLNELYEQRFGFGYVVFVAGRPKTEIVPLLERALHGERETELRRAVDDAIYIAGDRLRRLRGLGTEE